jgi:putative membrane protein
MRELLITWLLSALSLLAVAHVVRGFEVRGFLAALLAAIVIGLINSTLGIFLKVVTFPLTILTLGVFWIVINALMLEIASWLVPGFIVRGFAAAFFGALILSLVNLFLKFLVFERLSG